MTIRKLKRIQELFRGFFHLGVKYAFNRNIFFLKKKSIVNVHSSVIIKRSRISIAKNSELIIQEGTILEDVDLFVQGKLHIGKRNIINNKDSYEKKSFNNLNITINGNCVIGSFNRIRCNIMVRFNAELSIANHTNINSNSEIRSDEKIKIGSFNQISYNVMIWDTDTHNIYTANKRREITIATFPLFGWENNKPRTRPVVIGDDCWVGKDVSLLKGTILEDKIIVGFGTKLVNEYVPKNTTVISKNTILLKDNNI